jgi:ATP-binding cassette subfamily F protein 3
MHQGGNVMLLDEPTNHLDVYTREALEEALENFTGALIVVSHDRYFIDRVAENIILVEDGAAEVYRGNYSELVEQMKAGAAAPVDTRSAAFQAAAPPASSRQAEAPKVVVDRTVDRTEQRQRAKRIRKIDEEIAALEARIAAAEGERERNELLLCSQEVFRDGERVKKIQQQQTDLKSMIDLLYGKWETLAREKEEVFSA